MKQFAYSTLCILTLATLCQSGFANIAPPLRGELTTSITHANAVNILNTPVVTVPTISASVSNIQRLPTVVIDATTDGATKLDVTLIDDLLDDLAPNARHYPTNFPNRTSEYLAIQNIKHLSDWLEPYASGKNATFDVILRAAKINGMARNLNIGTEYSIRANAHMSKAIKLKPNHDEANFLYGMMIAEAGGFNEGKKYLDKAAALGYLEAKQSLAQSELLSDNTAAALSRLKALYAEHPTHAQLAEQVRIVENGGFYIWNIADGNLSLKPIE